MLRYSVSDLDPTQIIAAFDECMLAIWGTAGKRQAPFRDDEATAQSWIDLGVTLTRCVMVFTAQMERMRDRKANLPRAVKIFDSNIRAAIARDEGDDVDTWDCEYSRWRSRCRGWLKDPKLWQEITGGQHRSWSAPAFLRG